MKQSKKPAQSEHIDVSVGAGTLRRNPNLEGVLAVVDFVLAYLFFMNALDSGSMLQYLVGFLALGLGVRSTTTVIKAIRSKKR